MPLAMSRPWKHPNSGVRWLRKGVPEDLRALAGKREEKRSLRTRDPVEAKRRHAEALAEIEQQWANLRAGPKALTEREAHQIALIVHDRWLQRHLDNPSQQTSWNVDLADRVFKPLKRAKLYDFLEKSWKPRLIEMCCRFIRWRIGAWNGQANARRHKSSNWTRLATGRWPLPLPPRCSEQNSRVNFRLSITHLLLHKTPNLVSSEPGAAHRP